MTRRFAVFAACLLASPLAAQYPPGATPNFNNRFQQPVSPFLNLLRGGNPAANYYYGVRPAQQATNFLSLAQAGALNAGNNTGQRQGFFPAADSFIAVEGGRQPGGIRPSGHPTAFNNTLGYFGGAAQNPPQTPARPAGRGRSNRRPARPNRTRG